MPLVDWLDDLIQLFEVDLSIGTRFSDSVDLDTWALFRDGRDKGRQHTLIQLLRNAVSPDPDLQQRHLRGFQVLVIGDKTRASDVAFSAFIKAEEIYDKLHGQVALKPTGRLRIFNVFQALQSPALIGRDDNGNFQYSFNFLTEFREEG